MSILMKAHTHIEHQSNIQDMKGVITPVMSCFDTEVRIHLTLA